MHGPILVVEDDADSAEMLAELLSRWGYEVLLAPDGPTALPIAEARRPTVALIDIGLPDMDGFEVAGRLRATPSLRGTCLIAVTGYAGPAYRARSIAAGFHAHVVKPVDVDTIECLVRRCHQAARA